MTPQPTPILTPGQSEEADQILTVNWFNRTYPEIAHKLHHSPNGGYRDKQTGQRMKLMGTKAGFHDLVLFHPVGAHTGLVVEMKLGNGCLSPAQQAWIPTYQACGFQVTTCWGMDEAVAAISEYVGLTNHNRREYETEKTIQPRRTHPAGA